MINKVKGKIRRFFNQHHCYDYITNNLWIKKGLLLYDENYSYFDPSIYFDNSVQVIVSERKNWSLIKYDFINYSLTNPITILTPIKNTWEDSVNRGFVLKVDNQYYLYYCGKTKEKSSIGLAISVDGKEYKRINKEPIVEANQPYEKSSVMNPCVIYDETNKIYKMWYSAGELYEPDVICCATSYNGIDWIKHGIVLQKGNNKYDLYKVGACDVIMRDNKYLMYYIGYQNLDVARICCAQSDDGVTWDKIDDNPIICPSKKSWDCHACYKPAVYYDELKKETIIIYNGRNKHLECIGYAVKKE